MTDANTITLPSLLTEDQAAQLLNIRPQTLNVWRCTRRVNLPYIKISRAVRYRRDDVLRFIAENTVGAMD